MLGLAGVLALPLLVFPPFVRVPRSGSAASKRQWAGGELHEANASEGGVRTKTRSSAILRSPLASRPPVVSHRLRGLDYAEDILQMRRKGLILPKTNTIVYGVRCAIVSKIIRAFGRGCGCLFADYQL